MPHAVIEYSDNLEQDVQVGGGLTAVHTAMINSNLFQTHDIKTRAYAAHDFLVGSKGKDGRFVHVKVYLLEGRTVEQKQALSQEIFNQLSAKIKTADSITVDIRELDKNTYRKTLPKS